MNYATLTWIILETYTLIYTFLVSREHAKAAKAVKKAAKEGQIVSIRRGVTSDSGTPLHKIVQEWKDQNARIAELEELKEHILEQTELLRKKARRLEATLAEKEKQEKEREKEREKNDSKKKKKKDKKKGSSSSSSDKRYDQWFEVVLITEMVYF